MFHATGFSTITELLQDLPPSLRLIMLNRMHSGKHLSLEFFSIYDQKEFFTFVVPCLQSENFEQNEWVFISGDYAERVYFIVDGRMGYFLEQIVVAGAEQLSAQGVPDDMVFQTFEDEETFGDHEVHMGIARQYSCASVAERPSECLALHKRDLLRVIAEFPTIAARMKTEAQEQGRQTKMKASQASKKPLHSVCSSGDAVAAPRCRVGSKDSMVTAGDEETAAAQAAISWVGAKASSPTSTSPDVARSGAVDHGTYVPHKAVGWTLPATGATNGPAAGPAVGGLRLEAVGVHMDCDNDQSDRSTASQRNCEEARVVAPLHEEMSAARHTGLVCCSSGVGVLPSPQAPVPFPAPASPEASRDSDPDVWRRGVGEADAAEAVALERARASGAAEGAAWAATRLDAMCGSMFDSLASRHAEIRERQAGLGEVLTSVRSILRRVDLRVQALST